MIADNKYAMRVLLILGFPLIFVAHICYAIWQGAKEAFWEFNEGWRSPTSNRWNKKGTWDE